MFPSTSRRVLAPSQFEEVCFPHHWLKSSINLYNDLSLRHRANLIWMEPYRLICIFHFKSRRRSFKNLKPGRFRTFQGKKFLSPFYIKIPDIQLLCMSTNHTQLPQLKHRTSFPSFICAVSQHTQPSALKYFCMPM